MKMQREVYDAVRRDKNLYFKNLIETQDDLIDKQNLLQFNKKEIENLKSDLKKKDDYIVNLKSKNSNFEDLLKTKQLENDKLKVEFEGLKQICATQEKEIEKLKFEGLERAKDYKKVDAEYKKTIIDRDNISSQLIRRNDEVSLLHEKIMILTSDLSRSEREFQETKELINKYIRENRNLLRELEISKNFKLEAKNFAKEIINLNKELLREKNLVGKNLKLKIKNFYFYF
jgi:chromosome segregation ATPase